MPEKQQLSAIIEKPYFELPARRLIIVVLVSFEVFSMRRVLLAIFSIGSIVTSACAQEADRMIADKIEGPARVAPETMADVRLSFAPVVDQAAPAVVNVYTKRVSKRRSSGDPFFDRFFGRMTPLMLTHLWPDR